MVKVRENHAGFRQADGVILGVIFGCAEDASEGNVGIEGIVRDFGIDRTQYLGFEARRNRKTPTKVVLYGSQDDDAIVLAYHPDLNMNEIYSRFNFPRVKPLETAWDSNSFAVRMARKPISPNMPGGEALLGRLYSRIIDHDAIIMLRNKPELPGPQLMLLDNNAIPREMRKYCLDSDTHRQETQYRMDNSRFSDYSVTF